MNRQKEQAAEWVDVDAIKPWGQNPKRLEEADIQRMVRSIERFGWADVIVAREADGEIISGPLRHAAARSMGMATVPVRYLPIDSAEAHALAVAVTQQEAVRTFDESLGALLAEMDAEGIDLDGLGWTEDELRDIIAAGQVEELEPEDPDDVPEVSETVHSVLGEVYELGPHRLVCGDCRDHETVSKVLGGASINVAFTSPPYASQRTYDESSGFKPIKPEDYGGWFEDVQANVRAHLADDGSWFVNIKAHCEDGQRHLYVMDLVISHVREWGWMFVDEFCWRDKKNGVPGGWPNRFKDAWEPVFHFTLKGQVKMHPLANGTASHAVFDYSPATAVTSTGSGLLGVKATEERQGTARPSNVITVAAASTGEHSAAFPVQLPAWFVRAFSDPGDTIYDPFMGSGTTMMAAAEHGRAAYGCEISPAYCDVIRRRWTRWARKNDIEPGSGALDDADE